MLNRAITHPQRIGSQSQLQDLQDRPRTAKIVDLLLASRQRDRLSRGTFPQIGGNRLRRRSCYWYLPLPHQKNGIRTPRLALCHKGDHIGKTSAIECWDRTHRGRIQTKISFHGPQIPTIKSYCHQPVICLRAQSRHSPNNLHLRSSPKPKIICNLVLSLRGVGHNIQRKGSRHPSRQQLSLATKMVELRGFGPQRQNDGNNRLKHQNLVCWGKRYWANTWISRRIDVWWWGK